MPVYRQHGLPPIAGGARIPHRTQNFLVFLLQRQEAFTEDFNEDDGQGALLG